MISGPHRYGESDSVNPGVTEQTGVDRTTNPMQYSPTFQPGVYTLRAELEGFAPFLQKALGSPPFSSQTCIGGVEDR